MWWFRGVGCSLFHVVSPLSLFVFFFFPFFSFSFCLKCMFFHKNDKKGHTVACSRSRRICLSFCRLFSFVFLRFLFIVSWPRSLSHSPRQYFLRKDLLGAGGGRGRFPSRTAPCGLRIPQRHFVFYFSFFARRPRIRRGYRQSVRHSSRDFSPHLRDGDALQCC